jgi:hypothetical protein
MKTSRKLVLLGAMALAVAGISFAQNWGPIVQTEGGDRVNQDTVRTAREIASHSTGTPNWTNEPGFEKDVFTFTRIIYKYGSGPRISASASPWGWITDYPDSDLNLSFRLQQMTTIKVDPDGRELKLTDPALFEYPWIYMVEVGRMELRDEEIPILRKYLLNGGVLMADDFWGPVQWENFAYWMKKVLPERDFEELPMTHPIFHCVFWEKHDGEQCKEMHVRAILDDKKRIMVIATHNCDNGDGWEREGEDDGFFHEFSEKRAYPLGINIIFYVMTH